MFLPIALTLGVALAIVHSYRTTKSTATVAGQNMPTPALDYVVQCIQYGAIPEPPAVQQALQEAQWIGRLDIFNWLVGAFIRPVVQAAAASPPQPMQPQAPPAGSSWQRAADGTMQLVAPDGQVIATQHAPAPAAHPHGVHRPTGAPRQPAQPAPAPPGSVTVSGKEDATPAPSARRELASPIRGVDDDSWSYFVQQLEDARTDAPPSKRHVGRFRARRERLRELEIVDVETPEDQYNALVTEIADAHKHVLDSGLDRELIATTVDVGGREQPVTLSGVLGVIQAAGLENAVEWFNKPSDRERFPGTTKVFLQTNGAF